jgi:predicted secreted protein
MAIKGENGILYIFFEDTYKPVACLTSNSLNTAVSVIESQTKCNPGVIEKQKGTFTYSIDAEGELIDTTTIGGDNLKISQDRLLLLQTNFSSVDWKIDTNVLDASSPKYYGTAIISDLSLTQGAGDELSTFSLTLDGSGEILFTDPND